MIQDYIVVNGQSVVMIGEPLCIRKSGDVDSDQCTLARIDTYGLVIRDVNNRRKCIQFENIAEINGLTCDSTKSIKVHRG